MRRIYPLLMVLALALGGCAAEATDSSQPNYDETKKMVVDILKTDEGKKAIQDLVADEKIKEQMVLDQAFVKKTIEENLTSDKGKEFWKKQFEDPKFAETFAKSMQKQQEELMKKLMKDPDYQKSMIELYQNPDMEKQLLTVMKGQEFRQHLQKLMQETFESPLFKAKIQDLLMKAAEEAGSGQQKEGGGEQGGAGQGGGQDDQGGGGAGGG
ncbi:spore germination lipoprotein GerD [Bacillus marinisedimentorum]|uniref:spore germination lipoprotein GerD n=1 Tax=Bacillus marinisedimentorum TaxID=1821260 RepID=UPI0007E0B9E1|nr:spore germination lipoprotein GerD [Bacillus marinisedimentorum]